MNQNMVIDARWNFSGNIKVGKIATWSKLPGEGMFVSQRYGAVSGTCGGCCEHCGRSAATGKRPPCYVFKSHRYPSVVDSQARNTLSVRNNPEEAFRQLSEALTRKRVPVPYARLDQSGEVETDREFVAICKMARDHREIQFYIYTKKTEIVIPSLIAGIVPKNLTILISIWHDQGIADFLKVAHLPNVKAFVYCDINSDHVNGWGIEEYAKRGIYIDTFCGAYGEDRKMNHSVTCDKCKKCFNRSAKAKVVGCYDH